MAIPLSANGNTYNYPESGDTVWGDDSTNLVSSICAFLGNVGGGASLDAAAIIALNSTTKGLRFSRMTTVQRDAIASPGTGLVIYNTTNNSLDVFNGTAWIGVSDPLIVSTIRASSSSGLLLESNTGTDVALLGASSGANATFYGNVTIAGNYPIGSVMQVQTTVLPTPFSTTSTSFVDLTGLSVSITPKTTSSRILIIAVVNAYVNGGNPGFFRLRRGTTDIGIGTTAGSRTSVTSGLNRLVETNGLTAMPMIFVDSPASTSAQTYLVRCSLNSAGTLYVNASEADGTDNASRIRTISTITVMEIAG